MPDLDQLREATALIRQPALDEIVDTARRRRHRAVLAATATAAVTVLGVAATALLTTPPEAPAPASPAEKVVRAPSSALMAAAASVENPDVRIALWENACPGCAEPGDDAAPTAVLALTDDGFATTRHVPSPWAAERTAREGEIYGARIESVGGDRFLVIDVSSPREWLVDGDGEVSPVRRVSTRKASSDPRLWFRCSPGQWSSPAEAGWPDPTWGEHPWCALDPSAGTAYEWPARWNGSVEPPVSTGDVWGIDNRNQPTFAWWEADGERHRRFLAESPPDARGVVWGPPGARPTFFVHEDFSPTVEIILPGDGGTRVLERSAPFDKVSSDFDLMVVAADGALLAVRRSPEVMIWRAESLTSGDFVLVHATPPEQAIQPTQTGWLHEPTVSDSTIHIPTPTGAVRSDDDGRTWVAITRWR